MKRILLYTGGLDSICLLLNHPNNYFDNLVYYYVDIDYQINEIKRLYKQVEKLEKETGYKINEKLSIIELSKFSNMVIDEKTQFFPYRNLFFLLFTEILFNDTREFIEVYLGGTSDDNVHDNGKNFMIETNKYLKKLKSPLFIRMDFADYTKIDMIRYIQSKWNFFNTDFINKYTFSCYKKGNKECLSCPACFRKNVLLNELGLIRDFRNNEIIENYKNNINNYNNTRKKLILNYINTLQIKKQGENKR